MSRGHTSYLLPYTLHIVRTHCLYDIDGNPNPRGSRSSLVLCGPVREDWHIWTLGSQRKGTEVWGGGTVGSGGGRDYIRPRAHGGIQRAAMVASRRPQASVPIFSCPVPFHEESLTQAGWLAGCGLDRATED